MSAAIRAAAVATDVAIIVVEAWIGRSFLGPSNRHHSLFRLLELFRALDDGLRLAGGFIHHIDRVIDIERQCVRWSS
jgi:hypothetical protein